MCQEEVDNNSGFLLLCTYATKTIELWIENKTVPRFPGIFTMLRTHKLIIFILKYPEILDIFPQLYRIVLLYIYLCLFQYSLLL